MAVVAVDGAQHLVAVTSDDGAVGLRFDPGRQGRRVHQIGEHDRQPPDRSAGRGGGQQLLGVEVVVVDFEYSPGKRVGGGAVTAVDRVYCAVKQFLDGRCWRVAV